MGNTVLHTTGDTVGHALAKHAVGTAVEGGVSNGIKSIAVGGAFGPVGIALSAFSGIFIGQTNYRAKRAAMLDMYRDEVAAKLGKLPDKVSEKDIEKLGNGDQERGIPANKTISEEFQKLKHSRSRKMLLSGVSILLTVAVMGALFGSTPLGLSAFVGLALKTLAAVTIHKILEKPIETSIKKVFGTKSVTTHERIAELAKEHKNGKIIGREQVADVFISANKELSQFVQEQYGKPYDFLNVRDKINVTDVLEQYIPLTNITESLNSGRVRVSELAFSVEGQQSGVAPDSVRNSLNFVGKARAALHNISEKLYNGHSQPASVILQRAIVEYDNPTPARSFVERYKAEKNASVTPRILH